MTQLTPIELSNWAALYAGTALCCAIAAALSIAVLAYRCARDRVWLELGSPRCVALFVPRLWWRWQRLYLTSTPVTLIIIVAFGFTLRWS